MRLDAFPFLFERSSRNTHKKAKWRSWGLRFTFNLISLPLLDGSSAATLMMSEQMVNRYQKFLMNNAYFGMVGRVIAWLVFDPLFDPVFTLVLRLLDLNAGYG